MNKTVIHLPKDPEIVAKLKDISEKHERQMSRIRRSKGEAISVVFSDEEMYTFFVFDIFNELFFTSEVHSIKLSGTLEDGYGKKNYRDGTAFCKAWTFVESAVDNHQPAKV